VQYDENEYRQHLAAVQSMRETVAKRLSAFRSFALILTDSIGAIPVNSDTGEDWPSRQAIRADLSAGTVVIEDDFTLEFLHKALTDRGVSHEYEPRPHGADGYNIIRLSIDDALTQLAGAFAQERAVCRRGDEPKGDRRR
jgi:hypothetical protein